MPGRSTAGWVVATWLACASHAVALEQPIDGTRLVLKRTASGVERLLFVSKDPSFPFPAVGSADDPATSGMTVEIISAAYTATGVAFAPAGAGMPGWTTRQGAIVSFTFTNRGAPNSFSEVRGVVLRDNGSIRVVARGNLTLGGPHGTIGIRITTGTLQSCAFFGAATVLRDEPGAFVARGALGTAIFNCSDQALRGLPSGTCGDGVINQASEECDGTARLPECAFFNLQCGPPGFSTECQCCTGGGPFNGVPCCNPFSIVLQSPPGFACHHTRCDPPFTCTGTDQCQPDGRCCAGLGGKCVEIEGTLLNPCCGDLACMGPSPDPLGGIGCCGLWGSPCTSNTDCCFGSCEASGTCGGCRPSGVACTSDTDCCYAHCGPSGTCEPCREAGASCANFYECCSWSCNASGTCDACGPGGTPCIPHRSTCCSGCNVSTFSCNP